MEKYKVVRIDKDGAQAVMQEEHEVLDRLAELKGYKLRKRRRDHPCGQRRGYHHYD